jgi:hypothetical protein
MAGRIWQNSGAQPVNSGMNSSPGTSSGAAASTAASTSRASSARRAASPTSTCSACRRSRTTSRARLEGNDDRDQFAELAALLPGYRALEGYGIDVAGEGARRRRFGNAIFTRYSVLVRAPPRAAWPADPDKRTMPRVAVEATLQAPMGALRVTTTHLEYFSECSARAQAVRLRNLHDEACQRAARRGGNARRLAVRRHPQTWTRSSRATSTSRPSIRVRRHPEPARRERARATATPGRSLNHTSRIRPPSACIRQVLEDAVLLATSCS